MTINERLAWAGQALVGYTVTVELKSGPAYQGVFHGVSTSPSGSLLLQLRAATQVQPALEPRARPAPSLELCFEDVSQLVARSVGLSKEAVSAPSAPGAGDVEFGTDSEIGAAARGGGPAERELTRWEPAPGDGSGALEGLEDEARRRSASNGRGGRAGQMDTSWDQFALNEQRFGVCTDYAEDMYTTRLDAKNSRYSMAEADRLASEIVRGGGGPGESNVHIREDRGLVVDDSQMDEEDRYSGVARRLAPGGRGAQGGAGRSACAQPPGSSSRAPAATAGQAPAAQQQQQQQQQQQRPRAWAPGSARPASLPSAPIDIEGARREANKVRAQLTEPRKATSPYGTPGSFKSPLASPLVSSAAKIEALDLHPGVAPVDDATRREFSAFKAAQSQVSSHSEGRRPKLDELKQFSAALQNRVPSARRPSLGKGDGEGGEGEQAASGSSAVAAAAAPRSSEVPSASSASSESEPAGEKQPKKGLNPFAKSFSFNPAAKEFTPSFSPAPAAAPQAARRQAPSPRAGGRGRGRGEGYLPAEARYGEGSYAGARGRNGSPLGQAYGQGSPMFGPGAGMAEPHGLRHAPVPGAPGQVLSMIPMTVPGMVLGPGVSSGGLIAIPPGHDGLHGGPGPGFYMVNGPRGGAGMPGQMVVLPPGHAAAYGMPMLVPASSPQQSRVPGPPSMGSHGMVVQGPAYQGAQGMRHHAAPQQQGAGLGGRTASGDRGDGSSPRTVGGA